jgi:hypothetical protein
LSFTEHVFIEALVGAGVPQPHRVGGDLIGEQQRSGGGAPKLKLHIHELQVPLGHIVR